VVDFYTRKKWGVKKHCLTPTSKSGGSKDPLDPVLPRSMVHAVFCYVFETHAFVITIRITRAYWVHARELIRHEISDEAVKCIDKPYNIRRTTQSSF